MADLIKCQTCNKEVSPTAKSCPHCGEDLESKRKQKSQGIGCLVMIVIILFFYTCSKISTDTPEEKNKAEAAKIIDDLKANLTVCAQQAVEKKFRTKVKFPWAFPEISYIPTTGNWIILGDCEIENQYGTYIKSKYGVELKQNDFNKKEFTVVKCFVE